MSKVQRMPMKNGFYFHCKLNIIICDANLLGCHAAAGTVHSRGNIYNSAEKPHSAILTL